MIKTEATASEMYVNAADPIEAIARARDGGTWEPQLDATTVRVRVLDVALDQVVLTLNLPQQRGR